MSINCLIIDDEQAAIDILTSYIKNIPSLNLVATSIDPLEALDIVNTQKIDLVFIDIQMPELSGISFIKLVKGKCKFILTTAYRQYAIEGFDNNAIDYLIKPIAFERFLQALQKVQIPQSSGSQPQENTSNSLNPDNFIFVKTDNRIQRINLSEILFIEGLGNYVTIHTEKGKFVTLLNVKDLEESLPSESFARVHRSYIISLSKIEFIEGNQIYLDKDLNIPLGDTYKNQVWAILDGKIITGKRPPF
ncbi:LytTR family DNA-binding domain-containing protein [Arcicella aquatica]|uniref:LytTR family DNA-binding domain-containing protein n=1 Tax=Arcicella aquatica TaxID=217141 RepID=A0ABU5QRM4_9BACT|nr:LytTR family DNA-binding domain-containing protein [Arcicella aquatica]MEA5259405.1 LytTR family DNA-binding domain-containing protein [Arcicella aquatica]